MALFSYAIFGEKLSVMNLVGAVVIVLGIALMSN